MKKDMEKKNKNSQVLSHFNMGKSPEEKIKQQQSNSLKMKDVMNKYMVDNGLTKTEATYKVAIDGKSVEKKYTIIGTPEYAKNISQHILTINRSEYGAKMLNGLANTNDSLYFMQFKNKATTSSRVLDPYIDKNTDKYASIISLDLNRKAPSYGTTSIGNFLKTQNITNHQNIAVNSTSSSGYRQLLPEMYVAHELFHAWQNTGNSPKGNYFTTNFHNQPKITGSESVKEGNALRYTNQIRIDLGLGYIRDQYKVLGNRQIDTSDRAIKRWKDNRAVEYKDLKDKRGMLIKEQWEESGTSKNKQNSQNDFRVNSDAKGTLARVRNQEGKTAYIKLFGVDDLLLNSAAEKQNATQYALDTNKNNASIASASIKETNRLKSEQQPGMEA